MAQKKKMAEKADKRYRAKVTVGHDAEGRPIIKYASGKTKKELAQAVEELKKRHVDGIEERRRDILFGVYATEWYEIYKKPHLSIASRKSYATIFNRDLLPELANRQLRAITAEDLQRLINSKAGRCASDLGYISSILKNIFSLAFSQGLIDRDPAAALKKPAAAKTKRRALTEAETAAALEVMHTHPFGLFLGLLYYTGMRRGEAAGLQWQDVDFKERLIHVRRDLDFKAGGLGTVKTPTSVRSIPMPDELAQMLLPHRGIGEALVFPGPDGGLWANSSLHRVWISLMAAMAKAAPDIECKAASLRQDGGAPVPVPISVLTAHFYRHNYASLLYQAGVDVLAAQRILGHASPKTTMEIYTHLSEDAAQKNAQRVRDAFAPAAKIF